MVRNTNKNILFLFILMTGLPAICQTSAAPQDHDIIAIGDRRELFVDRYLIQDLNGVDLRLNRPRREGVALKFDEPWEGKFSAYVTILSDTNIYRMYYRGLPEVGSSAVTCYAESHDGITWTKLSLGLYEIMGTRKNNVILANDNPFSNNFCPFIDTLPGVAGNERYKAIAGNEKTGLVAFVSSDGIRWRRLREDPIFSKGMFDSQNVIFWSESEKRYVCFFRTWTGKGYTGFRTISRTTSIDFFEWTDPEEMDFGNTRLEHLYTNATQPYFRAPHIYLAFPKRFFPDKAAVPPDKAASLVDNPNYRASSSDAVFMTSRGGNRYDRTFMEAFIRPGPDVKDWVARDNTPALGMIPGNGRNLYLYRMSHYAQASANVTRYTLRLDGFASVHGDYDGGELITQWFTFKGRNLEINYETSAAGGIRVELQDENGSPIPGYSLGDCLEIVGNEVERIVSWKDGGDVSQLAGKPVRIRFRIKDGDLYSIRFRE